MLIKYEIIVTEGLLRWQLSGITGTTVNKTYGFSGQNMLSGWEAMEWLGKL